MARGTAIVGCFSTGATTFGAITGLIKVKVDTSCAGRTPCGITNAMMTNAPIVIEVLRGIIRQNRV